MNYGELKTLIAGYLHRADQTDNIITFITLAQARVNRDLDVPEMVSRTTQSVRTRYVTLPADLRRLMDVQIAVRGGRKSLMPMSASQMDTEHGQVVSGEPNNYCIRGKEIELQPTPDSAHTLELLYLHRLAALSADSATNDILTDNPNIYVYASMIEASPFIHADERMPVWKDLYKEEVSRLNEEAEDRALSGGPLQIMQLGTSTP